MKHEQFLKIPSIFIKKADEARVARNNSYIFEPILILSTLFPTFLQKLTDPILVDDSEERVNFFNFLILTT